MRQWLHDELQDAADRALEPVIEFVTDLSLALVLALATIGLVGGIGITAIGPGGVLPTIGLFALTDLSPAQVAGTAIVTHVATGIFGTVVYTRSGSYAIAKHGAPLRFSLARRLWGLHSESSSMVRSRTVGSGSSSGQ